MEMGAGGTQPATLDAQGRGSHLVSPSPHTLLLFSSKKQTGDLLQQTFRAAGTAHPSPA